LAGSTNCFLDVVGDANMLCSSMTAIFSSSKCTGNAILRSTKWIGAVADDETRSVIGGFHSVMEKGFLEILLEGKCRTCVCPARSLDRFRVHRSFKAAIETGRLAIVSSLPSTIRSNSTRSSHQRNQLVADLAEQIIITHASEDSRTEQFALTLLQSGRGVDCLDGGCKGLLANGAKIIADNSSARRSSE
jgi:predicted Rossmann fold nucleotide-binding protein DprA/Smf involved in DNA uptake